MGMESAGLIRLLGIQWKRDEQEEKGEMSLMPTEEHTSAVGIVHLSVLAALGEGAAWLTAGEKATPVAINANFFRPAKLGSLLTTEVLVVNQGKTIVVIDSDIYQDGKIIASIRVTFFIK